LSWGRAHRIGDLAPSEDCPQDPAYEQALHDELGRLAARPDAPVRPLLDIDV
jgi:hypothetical protein